jgi:D-alanine-D-alanine ligase
MDQAKSTIAVIFGGESVEHDVSILTGLQFLEALDPDKFIGLPVYVAADGSWWTGDALLKRSNYPFLKDARQELTSVSLSIGKTSTFGPALFTEKKGVFGGGKTKIIPFDLMVPSIHGSGGEDGILQGLLEGSSVPYVGCGVLASAATINKDFTKNTVAAFGIPVLPHIMLHRPVMGEHTNKKTIQDRLGTEMQGLSYPFIVKPRQLGSSVGVKKVDNIDELLAATINAFRLDSAVIIEPFVQNLVEYNVAVTKAFGEISVSAIERPHQDNEFLSFTDKYMAGSKGGAKLDSPPSEGMASLRRDINPTNLLREKAAHIRTYASKAFGVLELSGCVRVDFLSNSETGEIWLNEINTIPGSFAYFLWQQADPEVSFTELTSALIEEGFKKFEGRQKDTDVKLGGSVIFGRD